MTDFCWPAWLAAKLQKLDLCSHVVLIQFVSDHALLLHYLLLMQTCNQIKITISSNSIGFAGAPNSYKAMKQMESCSYFNYKSVILSDAEYFTKIMLKIRTNWISLQYVLLVQKSNYCYCQDIVTLLSPSHMLARSPLHQATRMVGISVKGTRYSRAGWAEFIRNREMKVATRPRMYAGNICMLLSISSWGDYFLPTVVMAQYNLYLIPANRS